MRRVLGVLSGKGGVGKTTVSTNLALAMHNLGEDVVVVDADLKNPTLGIQLGVFDYDNTLHDVMEKGLPLLEAMYIHKTGLKFVPSHVSLTYLGVDSSKLKKVFEEAYFTSIIDSPPGLGNEALSVMEVCDEALVVTTPSLPDVAGAMRTIEVAKSMGVVIKGIILNKVMKKDYEVTASEIEAVTGTPVIKVIPWDETLLRSLSYKQPVVEFNKYSSSAMSFYELASKLTGVEYSRPSLAKLKSMFKLMGNKL
ncbi:MAG: P-loop NTPase [Candidatus Altiarchaeota archaeon]|nr:P-loop NTPase [Candidatus Altiarchaeota archaeon]